MMSKKDKGQNINYASGDYSYCFACKAVNPSTAFYCLKCACKLPEDKEIN